MVNTKYLIQNIYIKYILAFLLKIQNERVLLDEERTKINEQIKSLDEERTKINEQIKSLDEEIVKYQNQNHNTVRRNIVRRNMFELKIKVPEEFDRFVMDLADLQKSEANLQKSEANLQKSEDCSNICGIHELTFTSNILDSEEKITLLKNRIKFNGLNDVKTKIHYRTIGFNDEQNKIIQKCFKEWAIAIKSYSSNINIKFIDVTHTSDVIIESLTDIVLSFIPTDNKYKICGSVWQDKTYNIIHIDIDSYPESDSDPGKDFARMEGLFNLVIKHKLGHAFGLSHSSNEQSIMFPFINSLDNKLNQDDVKNIFL